MERKVGEMFDYNETKLMAVRSSKGCDGCYFNNGTNCLSKSESNGHCHHSYRSDDNSVKFIEPKDIVNSKVFNSVLHSCIVGVMSKLDISNDYMMNYELEKYANKIVKVATTITTEMLKENCAFD